MGKIHHIITKLLIAFVLISIGFILGKNSRVDSSSTEIGSGTYIEVYYLHTTFRCVTCNTIESMTKELLDKKYSSQIDDGRIKWSSVDFQENEKLAEKFKVVSSCVVVANIKDGVVTDYKRLDDVWTKMKNKHEFDTYVSSAIDSYLPHGEKQ